MTAILPLNVSAWSRRGLVWFLGTFVSLWLGVAFTSLYLFFVPCMDNWCYFAPSAVARWPGNLTTPFLGRFGGANRIWGLHWPGVPFINSILFSFLPDNPAVYVIWHLFLWLSVAAVVAWITRLASPSRLAAVAAFLFVLCDRALSFIASWQRMELVALIVAAPLVANLIKQSRREGLSPGRFYLLLACTFVAPLTHPIAGALTAASLLISCWVRRCEKGARPRLIAQAIAFTLSVALLLGWFFLQPDLLAQFKDHARVAKTAFVPGRIFLESMRQIYLPLFTGPLFYFGGLFIAIVVVIRFRVKENSDFGTTDGDTMWALAWLALAIAAAMNIFKNAYYLVFLLLPLCPLLALSARRCANSFPRARAIPNYAVTLSLLILISIHGAFWATRSYKWFQAGRPNLRHELHRFWTSLPSSHHLYIPEALWEEAAETPKPQAVVLMNTIINNSSKARRLAYESYAYNQTQPGDLLVLDDCQSNSPLTVPNAQQWELIDTKANHPPGSMKWGYGFFLYRAR